MVSAPFFLGFNKNLRKIVHVDNFLYPNYLDTPNSKKGSNTTWSCLKHPVMLVLVQTIMLYLGLYVSRKKYSTIMEETFCYLVKESNFAFHIVNSQ